jgi:hypothetical protein
MNERQASRFPQYGWYYSIAVGFLTAAIWLGMFSTDLVADWHQLIAVMLTGFVCARVGAWLGTATRGRDHGWRAGAYTVLLFVLTVNLFMKLALGHDESISALWQQGGLLSVLAAAAGYMLLTAFFVGAFAWPELLLGYLFGTASFLAALRIVARYGKYFSGVEPPISRSTKS